MCVNASYFNCLFKRCLNHRCAKLCLAVQLFPKYFSDFFFFLSVQISSSFLLPLPPKYLCLEINSHCNRNESCLFWAVYIYIVHVIFSPLQSYRLCVCVCVCTHVHACMCAHIRVCLKDTTIFSISTTFNLTG